MKNNVIEPTTAEGVGTEQQEGGITMDKPYTFRTLRSTDMFLMFKIIGKIGVSEFAACFEKDSVKQMLASFGGKDVNAAATSMVGITVILEVANVVIGNLPKCEEEIFQMLANTSNLTVRQVRELDLITFTGMVVDFVQKDEFKDFIKVVSKSFKLAK